MELKLKEKMDECTAYSQANYNLNKERDALKISDKQKQQDIESFINKIRQLDKDNKKLDRENKALELDKKRLSEQKLNAVNEKQVAKNAVSALTREIEWLRKQTESEEANIMSLIRDKNMMVKSLINVEEVNNKNKDELKNKEQIIARLQETIRTNKAHITELVKEMTKVQKESQKFCQEASKANANLMQMVEEVKLKKNLIGELKKENIEFEAKLKQQQNLYEAVRSDRNLYSKNLIECQDEVAELKRKFKIATHQISQLKDEIDAKDQNLTKIQHDLGKAQKQTDLVNDMLKNEQKSNNLNKEKALKLENQIKNLTHIIKEAYLEHEAKKKELQKCVNERDILGTQLIRRNDELALLYEKIKILQTTLAKGEVQYQERLEDIRLLKFKIGDLKCELRIVQAQAAQIGDLRNECFKLN